MKNSVLHKINHPFSVSSQDLFSIEDEIKKYPYFQVLHLLKAKTVADSDDETFQSALAKAAVYCSSRHILFEYLNQKNIGVEENIESKDTTEIQPSKLEVTSTTLEETDDIHQPDAEKQTSEVSKLIDAHQKAKSDQTKDDDYASKTENEEIKEETQKDFKNINSRSSFNQWLHKNSKTQSEENETDTVNEKFKVIENFLDKNPKITPAKDFKPRIEISSSSNENMSHLMTETLAKIYVEQNKFDKAIKAYTILRLKYPEKSGYFADLIREIQELKHR